MATTIEPLVTEISDQEILARFYKRVKNNPLSYADVSKQLQLLASSYSVTIEELLILADTDQLRPSDYDKAMSLFALYRILMK
jgi:hypothetical protein